MAKAFKLFVSYRRTDNSDFVEHIRSHFMFRYGRDNVFMDFDNIPDFELFEEFIREKVRQCDVLIAIIGPNWLNLLREKEAEDKPDFVRIEIDEAIKNQRLVAPICIQGAKVPPEEHIPTELRSIFKRNVAQLRSGRDILDNIGVIMDALEEAIKKQGIQRSVVNRKTDFSIPRYPSELVKVMYEVYQAQRQQNWEKAAILLSQLRESGQTVPSFFNLEEREALVQRQLRQQAETRRMRELVIYQYELVRMMIEFREPIPKIVEALQQIWRIDPTYDPDSLQEKLFRKKRQSEPIPASLDYLGAAAIRSILGTPFEWCEIPSGKVYMGERDSGLEVRRFFIAKYPVTYSQFDTFLDDPKGFKNPKWWEGLMIDDEHRRTPGKQTFRISNHPRENVSWFDAIAFCRWLSAKLVAAADDDIATSIKDVEPNNPLTWAISLPTELEWQRAAQGNNKQNYPWGSQFEVEKCNSLESDWGQTTPVDHYPKGASPFNVMDMSGNVWEWTLNEFKGRIIRDVGDAHLPTGRGGSWGGDRTRVSLLAREGFSPSDRYYSMGFRLVRRIF